MLEDRRLLWCLRHGDRDALRLIYERHAGDLLTLAANLLHDPATAEDVVQDVFIGLVRSVPRLRLRRTLRAYLATAAANRARDCFRKRARERLAPIVDAGHLVTGNDGPVQMAVNSEEMHRLRAAVAQLPFEQREAIMLHVHTGLKFREIAEHQNVSLQTAISRYRYGLDKLRSMLNGEAPK